MRWAGQPDLPFVLGIWQAGKGRRTRPWWSTRAAAGLRRSPRRAPGLRTRRHSPPRPGRAPGRSPASSWPQSSGVPLVYTYVLDPASGDYRDGDVFTGIVKAVAPFPIEIDLGAI
jgi:hypothetical protein